ncbi:FadR family transcriptional regulator [Thalassospira sp. MA62]|nr:FadR family transcriptional regulator [Thalassospira sp. MA62]
MPTETQTAQTQGTSQERPKRIADQVSEHILDKIAEGTFLPGDRLPGERQLAESMGVSRVSVRAALQKLKTRGYLRAVQGGGTEVLSSTGIDMDMAMTDLVRDSIANLRDLQEIRYTLETWAARRAATNASEEDIRLLRMAYRQAHDPRRAAKYRADDDHRLHMMIGRATGSIVYYHVMKMLHDVLQAALTEIRFNNMSGPTFDRMVQQHHHAIVEAIAAHDPDAAEKAMSTHLQAVLDVFKAASDKQST